MEYDRHQFHMHQDHRQMSETVVQGKRCEVPCERNEDQGSSLETMAADPTL